MRTGEVFALTWDDIDFKNNVINIDKNVFAIDKSKNGRWYIGTTKTRGSTRKIYMCNTLKEILINFKKYQTSCKKKYKSDYKRYYFESVKNNLGIVRYFKIIELKNKSKNKKEVNLIFRKDNGFYSGKDIIKYPFKIIHNELGIKCRFYDLRGSFATVSLRNGCEIKDIAGVLGHKRIETTENYYVTSTDNDKMNVSKSFENSLKNLNIII